MKIKACRGVCIGVDRHLKPGELADLDAAQVQFLTSIGAVEIVKDPEPVLEAASETRPAALSDDPNHEPDKKASGKSGKKEK